jgi:pimeloyl-ACP methyl ester carboxylesterase
MSFALAHCYELQSGGINMFIAFVCGAMCSASQLVNYTSLAKQKGFDWEVYVPDVNAITADNARDLIAFRKSIEARLNKNGVAAAEPAALFGFSVGGKFAAKLSQDLDVKGLFLLDPVDGPPPFQKVSARFPIYLENANPGWRDKPSGTAHLAVVRTQLGELPGFGGVACVPKEHGSAWFSKQLGASGEENFEIKNAGHLDILNKPGLAALICPKGTNKAAEGDALKIFEGFLEKLESK